MNTESQLLHEVVITAIVVKDGKYLITRRSPLKKRFGGMWTVPGGKLETSDYVNLPRDTKDYWYNVLEQVLRREVKEEVGLTIKNIEYVTSLATIHADPPSQGSGEARGAPSLVISCMADWESGEVALQESETDKFAWVSLKEAKEYELLDGIYDELEMVEARQKGQKSEWRRVSG
ncbi:MAG: NUDIX domain-containing protein [bacterium]|nr:NUDIX domain-containing protein [bacterium]